MVGIAMNPIPLPDMGKVISGLPPIAQACTDLSNTIEDVQAAFNMLATKIAPVMGSEAPGEASTTMDGTSYQQSEVGRAINAEVDRLRTLAHSIHSVIDRIEL